MPIAAPHVHAGLPELLALAGVDAAAIRRDLDEAWNNRDGAVDG